MCVHTLGITHKHYTRTWNKPNCLCAVCFDLFMFVDGKHANTATATSSEKNHNKIIMHTVELNRVNVASTRHDTLRVKLLLFMLYTLEAASCHITCKMCCCPQITIDSVTDTIFFPLTLHIIKYSRREKLLQLEFQL